jgi:hypothetical protein
MDVYRSLFGNLEEPLGQDLAVGDHHKKIRPQLAKLFLKGFFFGALRLKNPNATFRRNLLDRARENLLPPPLSPVWLGHRDYLVRPAKGSST